MERAAEDIKRESGYLRGSLPEELVDEGNPFSHESEVLLKFHGIYQQDDRDLRRERTQKKMSLEYICMVRASIPGGVLSADQYLAMDKLADEVADGTLRITTRQGIQYHFTRKAGLRPLIQTLNDQLVTTLAACGDVVRNTMCCPAPFHDSRREHLHELTQEVAKRFRPKTSSYYEVWVDGEKAVSAQDRSDATEVEPLYGVTYLPRKFKIGVAFPGDNCVDAYTQDVAVVAHTDGKSITAFTVLIGGGFGVSHADDTTYPRLATPLTTVSPEDVGDVIEAIIVVQRDNGERGDRKHARLKYLIDRWGEAEFKTAVETQLGRVLPDAQDVTWDSVEDHLGWHEQGDGNWFLGVRVESGRVRDRDGVNLRSAVREIVERFRPGVRFTAAQDILFTDVAGADRTQIEAILRKGGVALVSDLAPVIRTALACPALPTCGLALTEAERVLPQLLDELKGLLDSLGLGDDALTFRVTGCPNGCARPYSAEIGLVGRGKTSYDIMLGGSQLGTRLTETYVKNVKRDKVVPTLRPLFERYLGERNDGESFGDWCNRIGVSTLAEAAASS